MGWFSRRPAPQLLEGVVTEIITSPTTREVAGSAQDARNLSAQIGVPVQPRARKQKEPGTARIRLYGGGAPQGGSDIVDATFFEKLPRGRRHALSVGDDVELVVVEPSRLSSEVQYLVVQILE